MSVGINGVLVGVMATAKGEVGIIRRFVSEVLAAAVASPALDPRGEGVSRNDPDIESIVSSLTEDLLLFSVIVSTPAS
jgi:hypothetical protein